MQGKFEGRGMGSVVERELAVGDWVRTKVWDKTKKGVSKWSIPKRIVKARRYSVVLEDGRRWNVECGKCSDEILECGCHGEGRRLEMEAAETGSSYNKYILWTKKRVIFEHKSGDKDEFNLPCDDPGPAEAALMVTREAWTEEEKKNRNQEVSEN
ncbi:hypothetical protein NDU88_003573 [Pleurodeles waltl]|uniref:Uncharacterized protein n=1 Tax=Pleurodeles waltl TaxID=8319 RepID=A0AAV7RHT8_PLEWA|nr:hypothetical protein NDU88_003573 [Pleurodeles waltl]